MGSKEGECISVMTYAKAMTVFRLQYLGSG